MRCNEKKGFTPHIFSERFIDFQNRCVVIQSLARVGGKSRESPYEAPVAELTMRIRLYKGFWSLMAL